jgi:metal-dependent hydrolase (beta-lactamase superfamily II)
MELLKLEFEDMEITCPIQEGHRMIPIKTVCQIIDVDFKTQDSWLKSHPLYSQLYRPSTTVAADGKERKMNCLSFFDTFGWLNSLTNNNRKPGSVEKQNLFMLWLREQHMNIYKAIELFQEENKYELSLIEKKEALLDQIQDAQEAARELKKELKQVDESIKDIREKRFTGQTALPFPDGED